MWHFGLSCRGGEQITVTKVSLVKHESELNTHGGSAAQARPAVDA